MNASAMRQVHNINAPLFTSRQESPFEALPDPLTACSNLSAIFKVSASDWLIPSIVIENGRTP